jgi:hypothetical protein
VLWNTASTPPSSTDPNMKRLMLTGALVALVSFGAANAALAGPACTIEYPRGFKLPKGTKKKPLRVCTGGDLQSTWGTCVSRFNV